MSLVQENVLGLDVPVNHVVSMRVVERVGDFHGNADGGLDGELLLLVEPVAQRLALHHRHDEIQESFDFSRIVKGKDVRVRQPGGKLDLAQEPLSAE